MSIHLLSLGFRAGKTCDFCNKAPVVADKKVVEEFTRFIMEKCSSPRLMRVEKRERTTQKNAFQKASNHQQQNQQPTSKTARTTNIVKCSQQVDPVIVIRETCGQQHQR